MLDSSESFLNIETEHFENLANASSKVGRVGSTSKGSGIGWSAGTERVLSELALA